MASRDGTKSIFITGAGSGIGRATAEAFIAAGWRVGLSDRGGVPRLPSVSGAAEAEAFEADVLSVEALQTAIAAFTKPDGGALDAIFNSAGVLEMRPFAETPIERHHALIDVNIKGVLNSIYAALPFLRNGTDPAIVTMSSVAAIYGVPEEAVYSATKFAVRGLTEALNIELSAEGIRVSDIMVAYVNTPMVHAAEHKAKSVGILGVNAQPEQVAAKVLEAVRGRKVHWFVTEADETVAVQVDQTPWEERHHIMRSITGFGEKTG